MKTFRKAVALALLVLSFGSGSVVWAADELRIVSTVQEVEVITNEAGEQEERLVDASSVVPGDLLRYTVTVSNVSDVTVDAGSIVVSNPVPENTQYIEGTAFGSGTEITFSADGGETYATPDELVVVEDGAERLAQARDYTHIRWVFQPELGPGEQSSMYFRVRLL